MGTAWINLGDTYSGGGGGNYGEGMSVSDDETRTKHIRAGAKVKTGLKPKCLLLIPHRFAIGCIDRDWIIRNDVIWAKRNGMPESITDRFSKKHEYFFFMVKSEKYFFDLDAIRDKHKTVSIERYKYDFNGNPDGLDRQQAGYRQTEATTKIPKEQSEMFGSPRARQHRNIEGNMTEGGLTHTTAGLSLKSVEEKQNPNGKNPGSVSDFWDIPTKPSSKKHYASYNDSLLVKPVLAGCPEGGIIYDPFMGTGSTAEVAIRSGRNFIGSEMSEEYCKIANERLIPYLTQTSLFPSPQIN